MAVRITSSENLLMSVVGHLMLVAIMVTSFALVVDRAKIVAPDRIEITEIDLSMIQVSGKETHLRNVGDISNKPKPEKPADAPPPVATPEPVAAPAPAPTVVDNEPVKPELTPADAAPAPADTPAPKKKTVVRVNRESLNRTLNVSTIDALRVAMTRCWNINTNYPGIDDIRAVAHLTMRSNGTVRDVWFESASRADTDPAFAYVLETIRNAIQVCQPFRMLPENEFDQWQRIQLTFYPTQGTVM